MFVGERVGLLVGEGEGFGVGCRVGKKVGSLVGFWVGSIIGGDVMSSQIGFPHSWHVLNRSVVSKQNCSTSSTQFWVYVGHPVSSQQEQLSKLASRQSES